MEIIGAGDRLAAWWKAKKRKLNGQGRTRLPDRTRTTYRGTETVRMPAGMRNALPANQKQQTRGRTTAKRPVRCQTCDGWYGALKGGSPRAHRDLRPGRGNATCPGGGPPKTPKRTPRKR